jgi:hypothetical protein
LLIDGPTAVNEVKVKIIRHILYVI